jgi:TRAP-type C4-dicarboxylate transport system substrate-binding protein
LTSLEDFEGVMISAPNETIGIGLEALGFVPRVIPGPEIYLNAQKGVIDATANQINTIKMESLQEVYDYILLCDFSQVAGACVINPEKYNSMPEEVREIVVNELLKYKQDLFEFEEAGIADTLQWCKDNGFTVNTLSDADLALMQEAVAPLLEEWIDTQEKAGMADAREYVEEFLELRDKYLAE